MHIKPMLTSRVSSLIPFFFLISFTTLAASRSCYNFDGTTKDATLYQPCSSSTQHSMCCAIGPNRINPDRCLASGLCEGHNSGNETWRESCTDPTWQSPSCVRLCLQATTEDIQLTQCDDGTYCCGAPRENTTQACCENKLGFVYDINVPNAVQIRRSTTTTSSIPSATPSTSETVSVSSISVEPSASPSSSASSSTAASTSSARVSKGAVAGISVGAVAIIGCLGLAGFLLFRRRRRRAIEPMLPDAPGEPRELQGSGNFEQVQMSQTSYATLPKRKMVAELQGERGWDSDRSAVELHTGQLLQEERGHRPVELESVVALNGNHISELGVGRPANG